MYCPKCGTQNQDGVNFCQKCGNALNSTPIAYGNAYNNTPIFKNKKDFLNDYYAKHPSYILLIIFSIIFDLAGLIVIIYRIANTDSFYGYISSSQKEKLFISIAIGFLFFFLGFIFTLCANSISKTASNEYETMFGSKGHTFKNLQIDSKYWDCPKCGVTNVSTITYCNNCGTKKPSANEHLRKVENDEWRCPNCGRINQNYVGTCGCGEIKP